MKERPCQETFFEETIYAVLPHPENTPFSYVVLAPDSEDFRDFEICKLPENMFKSIYEMQSEFPMEDCYTMLLQDQELLMIKDRSPEIFEKIKEAQAKNLEIYVYGHKI